MADSLYGTRNPTKTKHKPTSSNSGLSFSANLSSLIATSRSKSSSSGVQAPTKPKSKPDIFSTHNRGVSKRKLADVQEHQTKHDLDSTSQSDLHQSKRKMEEKARLYNAMKRGEYIPSTHSQTSHIDTSLVDFDRKWAESNTQDANSPSASDQSDEDDSSETEPSEQVTWTDEFGRVRKGTSKEQSRFQARQRAQAAASTEADEMQAHPSQPSNIIYGDTIQHQAFNPDRIVEQKMAELAAKRDRSATPPPDTHFDASWEIRDRGTGFYAFSSDSADRKAEQEALEKQRAETERARQETEQKKTVQNEAREKRKREIEERRKKISETRSKKDAERFLDSLEISGEDDAADGRERENR